ncbi:MAG TPA: hypothetical protein VNG93_14045 [Candidatus Dormibacteraeota bacterium]|nr:hypothetical protein [Candidatus Dormibacteraeota bacterium]
MVLLTEWPTRIVAAVPTGEALSSEFQLMLDQRPESDLGEHRDQAVARAS